MYCLNIKLLTSFTTSVETVGVTAGRRTASIKETTLEWAFHQLNTQALVIFHGRVGSNSQNK